MRDMNPPPPRRRPGEFLHRLIALAVMAAFAYAAWFWVNKLFARELAGVARWLHRLFN